MNKTLASSLRVILGISLASFLVYNILNRSGVNVHQEFLNSRYQFLWIAFLVYGASIGVTVYRWKLLLDVQGIHIPYFNLVQLTMTGVFFNLVIPGAVSGDLIKMVYVTSHAKGKTAEAVLTIFIDRVIGFMGLFFVAFLSVLLSTKFIFSSSPEIQLGAFFVAIGSICSIIAILAVEFKEIVQSWPIVKNLIEIGKKLLPQRILKVFDRFVLAIDLYRNQRHIITKAILLSMVVHTCLAVSLLFVGRGFHEFVVTAQHYILTTQVANAAGAIPITPAGIGSRDLIISLFFDAAGGDKEKGGIIPAFYTILLATWGLIGGIFYIFMKRK